MAVIAPRSVVMLLMLAVIVAMSAVSCAVALLLVPGELSADSSFSSPVSVVVIALR